MVFLLGGGRAADVFQTAFCVGKTDGSRLKNADTVRAAGLFGRRNAFFFLAKRRVTWLKLRFQTASTAADAFEAV